MKYGIDCSMFVNCDIKSEDPDFVIIRSGEGKAKDSKCEDYVKAAKSLGIPWGLYHVLRLSGACTVYQNLDNILDRIKKVGKPPMGVWLDVETPDAFDNGAINTFCQAIEAEHIYAGIYAGINQLRKGMINAPKFDKWVAYYGKDTGDLNDFPEDEKKIVRNLGTLWQYKGTTKSGCDLDVCFIDDLSVYNIPATSEEEKKKQQVFDTIEELQKTLQDLNELLKELLP